MIEMIEMIEMIGLDLPSLTSIECFGDYASIHCNIGHVLLESTSILSIQFRRNV